MAAESRLEQRDLLKSKYFFSRPYIFIRCTKPHDNKVDFIMITIRPGRGTNMLESECITYCTYSSIYTIVIFSIFKSYFMLPEYYYKYAR